jgi:predicted protein tyrosine phosphatase
MLVRLPDVGGPTKDRVRALFVCRYNQRRSATAERIFGKDPTLDVRSAGTSQEASVQVNRLMLDWADIVFVMDENQARDMKRLFPGHPAVDRMVCLQIQDNYHFLDPELVSVLEERTRPHFARLREG